MFSDLLDAEWQGVAAIKSMLDSPGWKIYESKIRDLIYYEKCQVELIERQAIKMDQLPNLNEHLCNLRILKRILLVKDELVEETETSPAQSGEQNTDE